MVAVLGSPSNSCRETGPRIPGCLSGEGGSRRKKKEGKEEERRKKEKKEKEVPPFIFPADKERPNLSASPPTPPARRVSHD